MHSMKRIQLAVVFLIAAAFLAGEPARAAGASDMTCVVGASDKDFGASAPQSSGTTSGGCAVPTTQPLTAPPCKSRART